MAAAGSEEVSMSILEGRNYEEELFAARWTLVGGITGILTILCGAICIGWF